MKREVRVLGNARVNFFLDKRNKIVRYWDVRWSSWKDLDYGIRKVVSSLGDYFMFL